MFKIDKVLMLVFIITILGLGVRVFKLTGIPIHLNHDEISQLYDAISLAITGKDIYGNFLPTVFVSVHDFKPPFYTYAVALSSWIFGHGEYVVKIPAVFFGTLLIPAVFFFTLQLLKNQKVALIAALMTAIAPFEIFFSRKSFESGAGIFFLLVGFYFLLIYIENIEKENESTCGLTVGVASCRNNESTHRDKWLVGGLVSLIVGMYTYFSHAVIIPLLTMSFIYIYRQTVRQSIWKNIIRNWRRYISLLSLGFFLVIPLLFIIYTNPGSRYRSQTVFILQDIGLGRQLDFIKSENQLVTAVLTFKILVDWSLNRYLTQFNTTFLFLNGLDLTNQGPIGVGPLQLVQLPLLILGIILLLKENPVSPRVKFIFAWILIGMIPSGLTFETHSPHRVVMVFTMLNILSAFGLYRFVCWIGVTFKSGHCQKACFTLVAVAFALNFIYFIHVYATNYGFEKAQYLHYPFKQVAKFAWSKYSEFDHIVFDPYFGETAPMIGTAAHYYFAYYGNYPPAKFQNEYKLGGKEREVIFDKFSLRKIDWREDYALKKTLLIASPWALAINSVPKDKVLKTFIFPSGLPAFYAITME